MPKSNFDVDEATLLKAYKISSLRPRKWEEIDHDLEDSLAGSIVTPSGSTENEGGDPLGLGMSVNLRDMDMESKAAVLITSKSFDPKGFLSTAHPNATFQDLKIGMANLERSIEVRSEAIKVLVEDHFDRFVAVKASTDAIYLEMREGLLAKDTEFGSKPLHDELKQAAIKANQVFLPVLENASKAQKLRTTLGVFERSKFFFNLPGVIIESLQAGRYEAAMRDYKKGKYLLDSRPGQLLPISTTSTSTSKDARATAEAEQQQKRILEKVWGNVEKAMGEMRNVLVGMLRDTGRSVEEQERTIEILTELRPNEEPAWVYFDSQHKYILTQMNTVFNAAKAKVEHELSQLPDIPEDDPSSQLVPELKRALAALEEKQPDTMLAHCRQEPVWLAIISMIKSLQEVLLSTLPNFWRVARDFTEGRFKKSTTAGTSASTSTSTGSRRSPTQCRTMALDIIKLFIEHLSSFFKLSDMAVSSPSTLPTISPSSSSTTTTTTALNSTPNPNAPGGLLPLSTNSIALCQQLMKIVGEVGDCVTELNGMEIEGGGGGGSGVDRDRDRDGTGSGVLRSLMESMRWRFGELLTGAWHRDAKILYKLETWTPSPSSPSSSPSSLSSHTLYLLQFELYQRHTTTCAFKLAGGVDLSASNSASRSVGIGMKQNPVSGAFVDKITKAFVDAVYAFLDGLVVLATEPSLGGDGGMGKGENLKKAAPIPMTMYGPSHSNGTSAVSRTELLDFENADTRLLIVVSNLKYLSVALIPSMMNQLEGAFNVNLDADKRTLIEVVKQLDTTLFESYVRPKAEVVKALMRTGVLDSEMDWYETPQPTEIRPYMYEILMYLVSVHAQVNGTSNTLLDQSLCALVDELAEEALRCFKQVKRFGMGGMLRATLEIEFLHQTLSRYVTPSAERTLSDLYNKISQAYARRPGDENLQNHLDGVKKTLADTRRATGIEFLCFRQTKSGSSKRAKEGKEGKGSATPSRGEAGGQAE